MSATSPGAVNFGDTTKNVTVTWMEPDTTAKANIDGYTVKATGVDDKPVNPDVRMTVLEEVPVATNMVTVTVHYSKGDNADATAEIEEE